MSSGWSVYHLQSHETSSMLRASDVEVVVIDVIANASSGLGPTSLSAGARISPNVFASLIVTAHVVDHLSSIGQPGINANGVLEFRTKTIRYHVQQQVQKCSWPLSPNRTERTRKLTAKSLV